jgi:hypothetical protein
VIIAYVPVITVASLLVINLGIGSAWAEKGDNGKKEAKSHDEGSQVKEHKENHDSGKVKDSGNKAGGDGTKNQGKDPPPQQSPPSQQDPLTNPPTDTSQEQPVQPAQQAPQNVPPTPAQSDRSAEDSIAITDALGNVFANYPRHISDKIGIKDIDNGGSQQLSLKKTSAPIALGSQLRVTEQISSSGMAAIPSLPKITVTSPAMLQVSSDQKAEITFDSTAAGTYSIAIIGESGAHDSQTLRGQMQVGGNSVTWDGKKASGELAPAGHYTYFIAAMGNGGIRHPPQNGDGSILVLGPAQSSEISIPSLDSSLFLPLIISFAVAAAGLFIISRKRRKSLTIYLSTEAASVVVDDVKETYPQAVVEDYIEPTNEGAKRYVGITIPDPKDGNNEWQSEVAEKVKEIAGMDTVRLMSKGKVLVL